MLRFFLTCVMVVLVAGCGGGNQTDPNVVARAGSSELTVARLAEITASSPSSVPIRADVIESLAMAWVDYSLLGLRAAAGDALIDSATIVRAAWPDVRAAVIDSFRHVRNAGRVQVTAAQVDSAYGSGDVRFLKQMLKRTTPATTAGQRDSLLTVITEIRNRLVAGGRWEDVNAQNDDPRARAANGAMGLVSRGQTVIPFETAAFALAPGELSGVIETSFGFHVIYRPALDGIRDEFASALGDLLAQPLDSVYEADLLVRKSVEMAQGVPAAVRYTAAYSNRARGSDKVLATYDGGVFTVGDLALWMEFLPPQVTQQVRTNSDEELVAFARSFVVRELEWQEAVSADITLSAERYQQIAAAYRQQLPRLQTLSGLLPDSLASASASHAGRRQMAARNVERYLARAVLDPRLAAPLPPGLAQYLREAGEWAISLEAIDRAVLEAAMLRNAQEDSSARGEADYSTRNASMESVLVARRAGT